MMEMVPRKLQRSFQRCLRTRKDYNFKKIISNSGTRYFSMGELTDRDEDIDRVPD